MLIENHQKVNALMQERERLIITLEELRGKQFISIDNKSGAVLKGALDLTVCIADKVVVTHPLLQEAAEKYLNNVKGIIEQKIKSIENKIQFL